MLSRRTMLQGSVAALVLLAAGGRLGLTTARAATVVHTDEEWHKLLNGDEYAVLRQEATESPFTSPLLHEERKGKFTCAGCDLPLFSSKTKFDSGTGWPSFWAPLENAVLRKTDTTLGMERTAVSCARCEGHLGHVFDDGPQPTGLRYCMNGVAMKFVAGAA